VKSVKASGSVRIPANMRRSAIPLIDQQMWCWGCDARRAEGNLLMVYGAEKRPSPSTRYHSAYMFQASNAAVLTLWSWGIWVSHPDWGSLFVSRSRFRVRYTSEVIQTPDAWRSRDLPYMSGARDETEARYADILLATALEWMGNYEQWLCNHMGPEYRERIVDNWPQRKQHKGGIPAAEMSTYWFDLSTRISKETLLL
jgi:hypothetical protein